jgi:secretion/DNA translocation related TadE-like protein
VRAGKRIERSEQGTGTILIMGVVILLLLLAAAFGVVGRYLVADHEARAAADLAALAGAQAYGTGGDGCSAAGNYAAKNGHQLADCDVVGIPSDFVLSTSIRKPVPILIPGVPKAFLVHAYAGPVR